MLSVAIRLAWSIQRCVIRLGRVEVRGIEIIFVCDAD